MADVPAKTPLAPNEVRVINAKDEVYRIPADQAAEALKYDSSFRPVTPEDDKRIQVKQTYGGGLGQVGAGLLGAARGLAGPLPDIAGSAIGGDSYKELARNLEDANPGTVALGEAAGLLGGAVLTGGANAAAKTGLAAASRGVGTAAAETVAKAAVLPKAATAVGKMAAQGVEKLVGQRAAGVAAQGLQRGAVLGAQMAAENALLDATHQLSEDIVRDHELHAENYVASAMRGALTGAAFGVPLGFVGGVLSGTVNKYASKLEDPIAIKEYERAANEHATQATGAKTAEYRKFVGNRAVYDANGQVIARAGSDAAFRQGIDDIGQELLGKNGGPAVVTRSTKPGEISAAANAQIDIIGKDIGKIHADVKNTQIDAYDALKKVVDDVLLPNESQAMTEEARFAAGKVRKFAKNIVDKFVDGTKFDATIREDGELIFTNRATKTDYFKDAGGFYRIDQTPVKITMTGPNGKPVTKTVPGSPSKVYENINPFRNSVTNLDTVRSFVKNIDRQLPKSYEGLYGEKALSAQNYMQIRGSLEEFYENVVGNQFGQDKFKELRELNRRYGIWKTIEKMSVSDRQRTMANLPRGLMEAQKGGIAASIGTHVGIAAGHATGMPYAAPVFGAVLGTVGAVKGADLGRFVRDRYHAVAAAGYDKVIELSKITGITKQINDTADKYIGAFVKGGSRATVGAVRTVQRATERMTADKYQKSVETVQRLNNDPQALFDHVTKALPPTFANTAPEVSASVVATYQRGINYLATKVPPPPRPVNALQMTLPAGKTLARIPSDADRDKWSRYVAAMENPLVMLEQAAAGRLDRETVETVKVVYPQMFAKIRQTLVTKVGELKSPLTIQQTTALSMILDTPLSASQEPDTVAMFQAAFDQAFAADGDGGTVLPKDDGQNGGASQSGPSGKTGDKPSRPIDIHGVFKTTTQGMRGELR